MTIEALLAARVGEINAVVFSGGEPSLHPDLPAAADADACRTVGLHIAGPYPERLEALLPGLDWVALDVKGRGVDFDRIGGRPGIWQRHPRRERCLDPTYCVPVEGAPPLEALVRRVRRHFDHLELRG